MLIDAMHMPEVPVNQQHDKATQCCQTWQGKRTRHMSCGPRFDISINVSNTLTQAQLSLSNLPEGIQAVGLWPSHMSVTCTKPVLYAQQILMALNKWVSMAKSLTLMSTNRSGLMPFCTMASAWSPLRG